MLQEKQLKKNMKKIKKAAAKRKKINEISFIKY